MACEWPTLSLRQAGVQLLDCEHRTPPAAKEGFPYIAIPQIKNGRIDLTEVRRISHEHFIDWIRKTKPQSWDVVLSRRCNPGETAFVPPDLACALGQNLVLLRSNGKKVYPQFLRWLLRSPAWWDQVRMFINVGAVFESLKCADIPNFRLPIPPMVEQQAMACILGALDDKIELNRRMNQTLEAMARAIFKSWFVDFDPVHARCGGADLRVRPKDAQTHRSAPPANTFEWPEHILDLFPDSFQESELGEIPKGWACVTLPEIVEVNPIRALRKGEISPYLDMANMPTQGHIPDSWIDRPFGSGMRFINGDTLIARITPCLENGKTAMVTFLQDGQVAWGSTEFIVLRPKSPLPSAFGYLLARSQPFRQFAIQRMSGSSGRQRVPADSLAQYKLVRPSDDVAVAFAATVESLFGRADINAKKSHTLAALRDTLLPKLISGELRVPHAERIVGRFV